MSRRIHFRWLLSLCLLAALPGPAQAQSTRTYSFGILGTGNCASAGTVSGDFGQGLGIEGSLNLMTQHFINSRVNLAVYFINKGPGGYNDKLHDYQFGDVIAMEPKTEWSYWSKGYLGVATFECLIPIISRRAPYLIGGIGIECMQARTNILESEWDQGAMTSSRKRSINNFQTDLACTLGLGYSFSKDFQIELKLKTNLFTYFTDLFGSANDPRLQMPTLASVSFRKCF